MTPGRSPSRPPAVAGSFYPDDPRRLARMIDELLEAATAVPKPAGLDPLTILGAVVPHAGLVYSGLIAALAWRLVGENRPETIVLAGTDHQGAAGSGIGVWIGGDWQTPLGNVPTDPDVAQLIAALGPPFAADNNAHLFGEHSLEVQLPILLRVFPEARIVPLAVSPRLLTHNEAGRRLGRLLKNLRTDGLPDRRLILVASSDFAHYPPAEVCEEADDRLIEPLLKLDADGLALLEATLLRARLPGLLCGLCGIDPVRVTLAALTEMGATRGILLGKATSADAGGDPGRTVGYASAVFA